MSHFARQKITLIKGYRSSKVLTKLVIPSSRQRGEGAGQIDFFNSQQKMTV
jgi:hypothetical protein